jgi:Ca-activated chloride channel homolog
MTFAAPPMLLGLLLPAFALAGYVTFQRTRRRYAVRFTNVDLLGSVAPDQPRWRRHVPVALGLGALALLAVGLARPQAWTDVERKGAQIVLATDASGSMQARDVAPDRLSAVRRAGDAFLARLPKGARVGVVAFNDSATTLTPPTFDRAAVHRALAGLDPQGGTASGDGIDAALKSMRASGKRARAIVLLSDGKATAGADPIEAARRAKAAGVPVYTVALGTKSGKVEVTDKQGHKRSIAVPPDPKALREIARVSGGSFVGVGDAGRLMAAYKRLGSEVGTERERRELTAAFAGAALVLLTVGSGLSLAWFGRFP